jgi:mannose-1-phosphate guanylyltransferase
MNNHYIVIMAGGSGTRLWPVSRTDSPKQFHKFSSSEKSLLQETYDRVKDLVPKENVYVSVTDEIFCPTKDQLPEVALENFIIEPEGKNTAPAIGLIATIIYNKDPRAVISTTPSDHTVGVVEAFQKTMRYGLNFIDKNPEYMATVGIKPTEPNTGYGYIKLGRKLADEDVYKIESFVEKPNLETAERYLKTGDYLWNAAYFIFSAKSLLDTYHLLAPEISERLDRIAGAIKTDQFTEVLKAEYSQFLKEPIDTVIAEKNSKMVVIPSDFGWSDVGTWASLYELLSTKTGNKNVSRGHHIGMDDKNCLIYAQDKLLATVGLEDVIIVDTPDVTLVCNKNKSQDIKKLIDKLKETGKEKYL